VEALAKKGDLLWAISTSGSSKNIVEAAKAAKEKGVRVISFTGKKASELEKLSELCFCAESKQTARTQEIHQIAYHIICELVEQNIVNSGYTG
jgi:D-sedoheptulose 7-phosphate isomerase